MSDSVVTEHEAHDPWCYVKWVDGRVAVLHLRNDSTDPARHELTLEGLRKSLGESLAAHRNAQSESAAAALSDSSDPDRRHALEFATSVLAEAAQRSPRQPQQAWFPDQADGRDASGDVHVSIRGTEVVILEAPQHALAEKGSAAAALREALNLAMERLEGDVLKHIERHRPVQPDLVDWAELSARADRFRT